MLVQQRLVVALFHDLAVGEDDDVIRMLDGGQTVCHDEHGANVLDLFQAVLDQQLGFGIDVGGGFVQDDHRGLMDDGAGEGEQLPLTGGEVVAALAYGLVQALFQAVDELVGVDVAAGVHDLLIADALLTQQDVAADIAAEQEHVLQHLAEVAAQAADLDLLDVDAVDEDLSLLDIVIAADQGQDGGLARARGAHEGHGLLGQDMEGHALQDPLARLVGEPHVAELDLALDVRKLHGVRRVHHLGHQVHDGKDLFRRGEGALEHVELLGQGLDGVEELADVHIEGDDDAAGQRLAQVHAPLDVGPSAHIQQAHDRGDIEHIHHGAEDAEHQHAGFLGLFQLFALFQEIRHLLILPVEDLGDLDAGEVFAEVGVDIRGGVIDAAVHLAAELAEDDGEQQHKGHEAQHHQRQGVIKGQHGPQHAEDHHDVFHQRHQDVGEHVGDGVGVVGHAGDQLAHGDVVQLLVAQAFDVGKDILAHGGQDLLARLLQHHGLDVGADHADHQDAGVHRHDGEKIAELKGILHRLLDMAHQQRGGQIIDDGEQHDQEHDEEILFIGQGVAQQAADDLPVRHVALKAHAFLFILFQQKNHQEADGEHADDGSGNDQRSVLSHGARLLPPPAFAVPPSCDIPGNWRRARHGCPRRPACRRR